MHRDNKFTYVGLDMYLCVMQRIFTEISEMTQALVITVVNNNDKGQSN